MSSARTLSYTGPNSISLTEIKSYCELFSIFEIENIEDLIKNIQELDGVYLKDFNKKATKGKK